MYFSRSENRFNPPELGQSGGRNVLEVPLVGRRVREVVVVGSGKDWEMSVELEDGLAIGIAISDFSMSCCAGMYCATTGIDDLNLQTRYWGEDLRIEAFRLEMSSWSDDEAVAQEFFRDGQQWIAEGFHGELPYAASAYLALR